LILYGYIIDVSHMSRQSLRDLTDLTAHDNVPYLNSHVPNLSTSAVSERSANPEMMRLLREHGGLLGLVPASYAPQSPVGAPQLCQGTVETYARLFSEATRLAAGMPIAFSSDFNGGVSHLRPTHGPEGCYPLEQAKTEFDRRGLADIGFVPDMIAAMKARGTDVSPMYAASERFLEIWARAEALKTR
jgi:microsomal dipeptidase-like Zn-dependent dipeptidase